MNKSESKTPPEKPSPESFPEDMRFRYIGFEIHSKRIPQFWKSEAEASAYAQRVRIGSAGTLFERDFSLLHVAPVSRVDKVVISLVALLMIGTLLMPWVNYRTVTGSDFSLSWAGALGVLFGNLSEIFGGGLAVGISAILGIALLVFTPLLGVWIMAAVWMKAKSDDAYLAGLRLPLKLSYWLFYSGMAIIVLALIGGNVPGYASWGLIDPGESYGLGSLLTILSYGAYAPMALGLIAGVESGDL